jgi:dipeptidyl aminopeptidase/acylaminoacyl peptidase
MVKKRGYTVSDLFRLKNVTDPQVSPDGRRIAYTVTSIDSDADNYQSAIWVAEESSTPRELTQTKGLNYQARWSPDGRHIAFLSKRSNDSPQLYVMSMEGGEALQVTTLPRKVLEFAWSPNGETIALTSRVSLDDPREDPSAPLVITNLRYKFNGEGYFDTSSTQIFLVKLDGSGLVQLTQGQFDSAQISWSPDGNTMVFVSARHELRDRDNVADIWLLQMGNRKPKQLTNSFGDCSVPTFSPDGKQIAFVSTGYTHDIAGRNSHIWTISASGDTPRNVSGHLDRSIQAGPSSPGAPPAPISWTPDGAGILARVHSHADIHLYRFESNEHCGTPIISGPRSVQAFSVSQDGSIGCLITDQFHPPEVHRTGVWIDSLTKVSGANDDLIEEIQFPEVENLRFLASDGTPIEGWVIKPLNMKDGEKYPLVLDVHGGPHAAFLHAYQGSYTLALPTHGCAVLQINPRGSTGWGERFARYLHGGRGELDFPEFIQAVDHVIDQGWVDQHRVGITGYSYGGYMTGWAIGQTDRFKAAVSGAGVCDLYSHFANTDNTVQRFGEMGGSPFEISEVYRRQSPLTYVQNISTPLLLMHGAADLRCNTFQSDQFFNALRYFEKEVVYIRFPGEHHGFRQTGKPSNRFEYDTQLLNWFRKWLPL